MKSINGMNDYLIILQFFKVYVYNQKGEPLSKGQIEKQLQCIVKEAQAKCTLPIGVLSADDRDVWANNYLKLQQGKIEKKHTNSSYILF